MSPEGRSRRGSRSHSVDLRKCGSGKLLAAGTAHCGTVGVGRLALHAACAVLVPRVRRAAERMPCSTRVCSESRSAASVRRDCVMRAAVALVAWRTMLASRAARNKQAGNGQRSASSELSERLESPASEVPATGACCTASFNRQAAVLRPALFCCACSTPLSTADSCCAASAVTLGTSAAARERLGKVARDGDTVRDNAAAAGR
ncbi:hypothetical protein FVE85_6985 [Porphyridium purpureum]|uniref:Uncharacterized protein n=1 Tax=Porphyridium purpureum TaxID=35688 RepID=A0A5J4Z8H1_PORPP|nr:hypothetical protein FVE85_6985 [Porphyridium purpureum]|eukprot:POR3189..scf295_1